MMQRHYAAKTEDVPEGGKKLIRVHEMEIGLFRVKGQLYAWRNVCPHAAAPVCRGLVCGTKLPSLVYEYEYGMEGQILRCPWHGWEFDLQTGKHLVDPEVKLRGFELEIEGEDVYVLLPKR
ncbi:MAG: Rieske iron-sulfur protein [Paenibacillus sp.]|jgi:nitrite reductase/ring-hydroxylating ferredoxin subunit|nr:Rieske iron-sulfur protein [Paenibacillus sp.]